MDFESCGSTWKSCTHCSYSPSDCATYRHSSFCQRRSVQIRLDRSRWRQPWSSCTCAYNHRSRSYTLTANLQNQQHALVHSVSLPFYCCEESSLLHFNQVILQMKAAKMELTAFLFVRVVLAIIDAVTNFAHPDAMSVVAHELPWSTRRSLCKTNCLVFQRSNKQFTILLLSL